MRQNRVLESKKPLRRRQTQSGDRVVNPTHAENHMTHEPPLVGVLDCGLERELVTLSDVVEKCRRDEDVRIGVRILLRERATQRGHTHRVLEQTTEVGMVMSLRTGTLDELGEELLVAEYRPQHALDIRCSDGRHERTELGHEFLAWPSSRRKHVLGRPVLRRQHRVD